jgi:hypothetical protein
MQEKTIVEKVTASSANIEEPDEAIEEKSARPRKNSAPAPVDPQSSRAIDAGISYFLEPV